MTIKLPRTITSDVMKEKNLVITISGEDIIYFNNKIFTVKELPSELHKYIPASPPSSSRRTDGLLWGALSMSGTYVGLWALKR